MKLGHLWRAVQRPAHSAARDAISPRRPVLIKIAPDLDEKGLDDIVAVALARKADGLIVSNTTIARPPSLKSAARVEAGGLSGRPLFEPSTRLLALTYQRVGGALPLIGCGGVEDARTALAKIEAGATLVELYTALALQGRALIPKILMGLAAALDSRGVESLGALKGTRAADWARR